MSNQSPSNQKFRPYLTLSQIQRILQYLKSTPQSEDGDLIATLETLVWKAGQGLQKPAYETAPPWAQKLGLQSAPPKTYSLRDKLNMYAHWQAHRNNPNAVFSKEQLAVIEEYRYTNNLMTPEEESAYSENLLMQGL